MFDWMRRAIFPIIIITLVFFVALIVLEWGLGFSGKGSFASLDSVAVINGEKVPWQSYYNLYQNLYQNEVADSDADLPESRVKELEQIAFNQLLQDRLLMQQADKNNITVTDKELYSYLRFTPPDYVRSIPQFQTNGQFDQQKYAQAMVQPEAAPFWASVEQIARQDLRKLKMQEQVIQAAIVTENEVKDAFMADQEKLTVGIATISYNSQVQPKIEFTDEQLQAYYNEHIDDFKREERRTLKVAVIDKEPTELDWERVGLQMKDIYDSAKAGADFAELAKTYSADNSASNGGDLGWFPQGQMVQEFDKRSFELKDGDISEPFRTQFGWHILKHQGYRTDTEVPRGKSEKEKVKKAHVSHILLRVQPSQETLDQGYQNLVAFQAEAKKVGFDSAAVVTGIAVRETEAFARGTRTGFLGFDASANAFAFENKPGAISEVLDNNSAMFVVQVEKELPAGPEPYNDVVTMVRANAERDSVLARCMSVAKQIELMVKNGTPLEASTKDFGGSYNQQTPVTRNTALTGVGRVPEALGAVFGLKEAGARTAPQQFNGGSVILELLGRTMPDLTIYNEKRDSIYQAVKVSKQQQLYSRWFQKLVDQADVVNNLERSEEAQQAAL
jgi:peptidyl-prolyl cis-trans isomerase D